jgi:phosphomevalonate kinase
MPSTTVVSSPGKVLITGGYLILDPVYSGTVISTSSRFYTVVQDDESAGPNIIRVRSPQFKSSAWEYTIKKTDAGSVVESSLKKCVTHRSLRG